MRAPMPTNSRASHTATIANGAQASDVIDMQGMTLVGMEMPGTLTGSAMTFQACDTKNGTFVPIYNSAGAVSQSVAASRYYALNPADFYGVRYLKVVSGSAEAAARSIKLFGKAL